MTRQSILFGGGGIPKLGTDTDWPFDKNSAATSYRVISAFDASSGPADIFGGATPAVAGPGMFTYMELTGLTDSEALTITLIVDGVTRWNKAITQSGTTHLLMGNTLAGAGFPEGYRFESTWVLNLTTAVDSSINIQYMWRPIL